MNALVPQGKAKKNLDRKTPEPVPVSSDRRRILGFLLVLLAAFILLPELNFFSSDTDSASDKVRAGYLKPLPDPEPWPEQPQMQALSAPIKATRVPEAELATFESQWVKEYAETQISVDAEAMDAQAIDVQAKPSQSAAALISPENSAAFIVQVATLRSKPNADALVLQLQASGYRSFLRQKGPYHQVIVGPQLRREDAETALQNIQRDLSLKGLIKAYRP